MERVFARELKRLDDMIALGLKVLTANSDVYVGPPIGSYKAAAVVMGLYAKAVKTARAVRLVATADLAEDGLVLCRSLIETMVAILYLLQKGTKKRTDEYVAHLLMRTKKIMRKWSKTRGLKRMAKRIEQRTDERLKAYAHIKADRLKQLEQWYSGDPTIEKTFKRVGLGPFYAVVYARMAGHQHVSDVPSHVSVDDPRALTIKMGSSDAQETRMLLDITNRVLWTAMRRVAKELRLGYEAEIERHKPPEDRYKALITAWLRRRQQATPRAKATPS